MNTATKLMPSGKPIYSCGCLESKEARADTEEKIEAVARGMVEAVALNCGNLDLCAVAGTRIMARALVYANSMQMTVFSKNGMAVTKNDAEQQLIALVEDELARGDAEIGGIDTVYKRFIAAKPASTLEDED